jgi:ribonuclease P protein component
VLPAPHRLRRRRDFGVATRRGHGAGSATVVAHLAVPPQSFADPDPAPVPRCESDAVGPVEHHLGSPVRRSGEAPPARVGFVVSGAVGPAVVRNKVRRRLRHLTVDHLRRLPDGALLVVRALPGAAGASSAQLAADLTRVLDRLVARHAPRSAGSPDVQV